MNNQVTQKLIELCEEMLKEPIMQYAGWSGYSEKLATLRAEAEKDVNSEFDSIVAGSSDIQRQIQKLDDLINKNCTVIKDEEKNDHT